MTYPKCNFDVPVGARFCRHCGTALAGPSGQGVPSGAEGPWEGGATRSIAPDDHGSTAGSSRRILCRAIALAAIFVILTASRWLFLCNGRNGNLLYTPTFQGLGLIETDLAQGGTLRVPKTTLFNNSLLVVNRRRRKRYVAAINGDYVSVVDSGSSREITTMRTNIGWNTHSVVLSQDGKLLYLGCATGGAREQPSRAVAFDIAPRHHVAAAVLSNVDVPIFLTLSPNGHTLSVS